MNNEIISLNQVNGNSKLHVIDADVKLKAIFENIVKRESARAS